MKSNKFHFNKIFLIVIAILLSASCVKEEFDQDKLNGSLTLTPSVATPIGFMTFTLTKFLENPNVPEQLTEDEDGFLTVMYHKRVFSSKAGQIMKFPPIVFSAPYVNTMPVEMNLNLLTDPIVSTDTTSFDFSFSGGNGDEHLDSIVLKSAYLTINSSSQYDLNGQIKLTFPGITLNGAQYSKTVDVKNTNEYNDLNGYTIALKSEDGQNNLLEVIYEITLNNSDAIIPPGGVIMNFGLVFSFIDYETMFGYIGQQNIDIAKQSFSFDCYNRIVDGVFHFAEPKLNILINNSYGAPLEMVLSDFEAETRDNGIVPITGDDIPDEANPRIMNYPGLDQIGQSVSDSLYLDGSNNNLFAVLESVPLKISFGVDALSNPNGQQEYNFVTSESQYDVDVQFELPIYGYADFLVMQDTIQFDFTDIYNGDIEEIKRIMFEVKFTNCFPVEIYSQIYFADGAFNILDSMFTTSKFITGGIDQTGDGKVDPVVNDAVYVEFQVDKVDKIQNTKYLFGWSRINTTNADANPPENVKFYSDYYLYVNLGVVVDIETNPTE
jgi:hypothetical protein